MSSLEMFAAGVGRPSMNPDVEHDGDQHVDRRTAQAPRFEPPLARSEDSLFVEASGIQRSNHSNIRRSAVPSHDELQDDRALDLLKERVARVGWFDLDEHARRCDGAAWSIDAATDSAAGAWTDARASSSSDTRSHAFTNAAT